LPVAAKPFDLVSLYSSLKQITPLHQYKDGEFSHSFLKVKLQVTKGTHRASDSRVHSSGAGAAHQIQLRRHPRNAASVRTLRPRARRVHRGDRAARRFEQARGGTLFLDEIGELPPALQVLLGFLQSNIINLLDPNQMNRPLRAGKHAKPTRLAVK